MQNTVWVWCSLILGLTACEASHQLGSDCPDDVCPRAAGRAEPACLVREDSRLIKIDYGDGPLPDPVPEFVVSVAADPDDFGTRRVFWEFGEDLVLPNGEILRACDDVPYLEDPEPNDEGVKQLQLEAKMADNPTPLVCLVKQATRTPEGEFQSEGWYYGEDTQSGLRTLRYSSGVGYPPNEVTVWMTRIGAEVITRDGTLKVTDASVCSLPDDSAMHEADVGRSCSPSSSREGGYGEAETVIETGSTQCATGACVVYRLAGDPKKPCGKKNDDRACLDLKSWSDALASEEEIAKRVYCSCRCDAPDGDPGELCTCKSGFSCVPALFHAAPGVRGSYCLKDGTFVGTGL
jgi:hypothetical protein